MSPVVNVLLDLISTMYSRTLSFFFFTHLRIHLLILEREEGRKRERDTETGREKEGETRRGERKRGRDVRDKHRSFASCTRPDPG